MSSTVEQDPAAARRRRVEAAVRDWTDQLIDLGGTNRLLYYRDLKVGTLELTPTEGGPVNAAALEQLRAGRKTRLRALLRDPAAADEAARKLRAISAKALENFEERGIQTLFLACGMATWTTAAEAATPAAPVLLLPISAVRRNATGDDFDLDLAGDPEINPTLVHFLSSQQGITVDTDAVLAALAAGEAGPEPTESAAPSGADASIAPIAPEGLSADPGTVPTPAVIDPAGTAAPVGVPEQAATDPSADPATDPAAGLATGPALDGRIDPVAGGTTAAEPSSTAPEPGSAPAEPGGAPAEPGGAPAEPGGAPADLTGAAGSTPVPLPWLAVLDATMRAACADVAGFAVAPRVVLGNFSFAKLPMVRDLEQDLDQLVARDLVAAIAGDPGAQAAVRAVRPDVPVDLPDAIPPEQEFLVLPADASQHHAINRVLAGESVMIQGPPGTGKSQTIANLITSLVASGRSVLFVAEKRAAIDAVVKRIEGVGLGDVLLDLHRDTVSRAKVAANLAESLRLARSVTAPDNRQLHENLTRARSTLSAHDHAMHDLRAPWGSSLFDVQARILGFPVTARSTLRFPRGAIERLDPSTLERLVADLGEHLALAAPTTAPPNAPGIDPTAPALPAGAPATPAAPGAAEGAATPAAAGTDPSPPASPSPRSAWADAAVATTEQAERALQWAEHLARFAPTAAITLATMATETGLSSPDSIAGWRERVAFLVAVREIYLRLQPQVFDPATDLDGLVRDLAPAGEGAGVLTSVFSGSFRAARKRAAALARSEPAPEPAELLALLRDASARRDQWRSLALDGGTPRVPTTMAAAEQAMAQLDQDEAALTTFLPGAGIAQRDVAAAGAWAAQLVAEQADLFRLPRRREIEAGFAAAGATAMLDFAHEQGLDAAAAAEAFRYAWYQSIYAALAPAALGAFDGGLHRAREREYAELDRRHLETTVERVRRAVAERVTAVRNQHPDQSQLVENQAGRKRGHLPVRRLFAQAPDVLTALKPCWTMSPLLVSQLLPGDRAYFDVVIFDEASQVTPADAIPALLRGRQAVVAGDSRQLPPTSFFATDTTSDLADEELDAADGTGDPGSGPPAGPDLKLTKGYESVLDVVTALLAPCWLTWHYRSRDERLIAFSNTHIYGGTLTTFPGVAAGACVRHELVTVEATPTAPAPATPASAGSAGSTGPVGATGSVRSGTSPSYPAEIERVVDLVVDHARTRPNESLGVITMGIRHAEQLEEAVRLRLAATPDVAEFFAESRAERFFVKNLERVQGDERDAIILTIGYGKDADGRLPYRFGPLLVEGGERRLNVAVTRARVRMTLVSSFTADDMDPDRSTAAGVELLRQYLRYAASGGDEGATGGPGTATATATGTAMGTTALDVASGGAAATELRTFVLGWLQAAGLPVEADHGMSGARLDLAVEHPDQPGRMVLAVESDGPTYHAGRTTRDRDRLRQEVLERLGWAYQRTWSTDWFRAPQAQVDAVTAAWREAVAKADAADAAAAAARAAATTATTTAPPTASTTASTTAIGTEGETTIGTEGETTIETEGGTSTGRAGPMPVVGGGRPITDYGDDELVDFVRWLETDTRLRTDDELLAEAVLALGYQRRGARIEERLRRAIATADAPTAPSAG